MYKQLNIIGYCCLL